MLTSPEILPQFIKINIKTVLDVLLNARLIFIQKQVLKSINARLTKLESSLLQNRMKLNLKTLHFYTHFILFNATGGWKPIPAVIGCVLGCRLDRILVPTRDNQQCMPTFRWSSIINPYMFNSEWKMEYLEKDLRQARGEQANSE